MTSDNESDVSMVSSNYIADDSFHDEDDDVDRFLYDDDDNSDFENNNNNNNKQKNQQPKKPVTTKNKKTTTSKVATSTATNKKKKGDVAPLSNSNTVNAAEEKDDDTTTAAAVTKKTGGNNNNKKKTIEEIYQKKTQLEHILIRPDTYIGSVERVTQNMYVLQQKDDGPGTIVEREITFTPGLYKIFDEIVVNAADNKQRCPEMDKIEITINPTENKISVLNNGTGIPVVIHKEHNVYVPTMIFGHLLTGSNFDDNEQKTTGGRNGYGAKLANVFSTEFIVECVDTKHKMKFHQVFRNNMSTSDEPKVKACTAAEAKKGDYVKITFSPDLVRFGMKNLDDDIVDLFSKRAYDIAGSMSNRDGKKLNVYLNGKKLSMIKSFKDYLSLYDGMNKPVAYEKDDKWEVGVAAAPDSSMTHVSFVNAICTSKGGGHVTYIADQVASHLVQVLKKKKLGADVKPAQIKNHLSIFVNCLIVNPAFDSQTKENLTTKPKSFGSTFKLSDKFLKQVEKSDVVDTIVSYVAHKQNQQLKRKGGTKKSKLTGIPKLDDANNAGTTKSAGCTLIITEGDSAKSLAMSGISVVGRDNYGVFPLRGKLLNVRDASQKAILDNAEIQNLVNIMGLKFKTKYDQSNIKTLRYGHLMIMADQDTDGSHIKGLVINFLHNFWPSLLDIPGFLLQFITPIVKVTKGKKSHTFFTLPEYTQWLESTNNNGKGYSIKYYKGLGTSTSAEGKEYFSNLDQHEIKFAQLTGDKVECIRDENEDDKDSDDELDYVLPDVVKSGSDLIDMVFRKTRVEDRKQWLNNFTKDLFMDYSVASQNGGLKYSDFINREYIQFSKYDNERSIPHLIDGFKPSQRKVLFGCFKRNLKKEVKVAQLTGYVAEHSSYHHGETSLQMTIVNMAQNFVGSNNVNLLTPSGQFGTRRMGGKDHASARYIFTKLEPITRVIFHPDDDELLNYLYDDGLQVEPEYYVPVIPLVLVNGAEGIGTGWSTNVCNYSPHEIIANLRRMIAGEEAHPMMPHYQGFVGDISAKDRAGSFLVTGKFARLNDTTLEITELPLKKWTQDFKQFLEGMLTGSEKKAAEIKDFKENHTDTTVHFTVTADKAMIDAFEKEKEGIMGKFKLSGSLATTNMNLFDATGRITKYDTPEQILTAFYALRLEFYVKRKDRLVEKLETEQKMLSNKARFVEEVCSGELIVSNRKKNDLLMELKERNYDLEPKHSKKTVYGEADDEEGDDSSAAEEEDENSPSEMITIGELSKGYEYLLGMKIWSLTYEKSEELRALLFQKTKDLTELKGTSPSQIWMNDLDALEDALKEREDEMLAAAQEEARAQKKSKTRQKKVAKKEMSRKNMKNPWDADESDEEDDIDRMLADLVVSPPGKNVKKRPSPRMENVENAANPTATMDLGVTTKAKQPNKRVRNAKSSKKVVATKKKAVVAKKTVDSDNSDDELSFDSDGGAMMQKSIAASRGRNTRGLKKANYNFDMEDSDDME